MEVALGSRRPGIKPRLWFPDESLYSFCTRSHILGCDPSSSTTLDHHFGQPTQASLQDLPANLEFFADRHGGNLGDWKSLIWDRTMAPFYLPFLDPDKAKVLVRNMRSGNTADLLTTALSCASRLDLHNTLKQCPACVEDDDTTYFMPYWHRTHQLPGVWCCPIHDQPLFVSLIRSKRQLHLPHPTFIKPNRYQMNDAVRQLCRFTLGSCRLEMFFHFDRQRLQRCYSLKLNAGKIGSASEVGFGVGFGSFALNWSAVGKSFHRFLQALRDVPALNFLPETPDGAAHLVAVLLRQKRSLGNPLYHLCIATWLFESFDDFEQAYLHA